MPSSDFDRNLEKYAEVIVKIGLNLQPGQRLLISGPSGVAVEAAPLVRVIAVKAYQVGARYVDVIWGDPQLTLIRFQHAPRDSFEEISTWMADTAVTYGGRGDAVLIIVGQNPDLLKGQDPELVSTLQRAIFQGNKGIQALRQKNATNWVIVTAPVPGWSAKVLPDVPAENREARMWDTIFEMCHVKQDDPVAGWRAHSQNLIARSNYLTNKGYATLNFTAPGTRLKVGLPKGHIWYGGGATTQKGTFYMPNIPTEEVFTMPHKDQVEGMVTATKPLHINGTVIEKFILTFEAGRVVKAVAEKGEVNLHRLLETDEGARGIGEVALVPHSSPISQSNLLFYNTLFDENASNHIALGNAYRFSMRGGETMSGKEFAAVGGNQSLIHVDFMVGSDKMDVDGLTESGVVEPIMRDGNWTFDI